MDDLRVPAYGQIDQAAKAFLRLLRDRQTKLIQREGVLLPVKYAIGKPGSVLCVGITGVDIPAHADPRRLENFVEGRNRGGFGLGEGRGRGCEQRGDGGSKNKFFHCLTFPWGRGQSPSSQ